MEWPADEESSESPARKGNSPGLSRYFVFFLFSLFFCLLSFVFCLLSFVFEIMPDAVLVVCADEEADIRS